MAEEELAWKAGKLGRLRVQKQKDCSL